MKNSTIFRCAVLIATALAQPVFAQDIKGSAAAGEKKINQCIGCHGLPGYQASFPEIYRVPMIFGQNEKYIASALNAYKKGERKHPSMRGVVDNLSDQDVADIAAYYGGTKSATKPAATAHIGAAEADAAITLVKKGGCQSCHGDNFNKPIDPSYPKVAGQYADYLAVALRSYKSTTSAVMGRNNAVMGAIIKPFSNAEISLLASYLASLPGDLETIPQAKFK